ncbi:MAG: hypothetical protein KAG53_11390 [Endozoicomonadaceae bacterium]|nr:hypothetical protein [Endozoicomonadaceae bacterium]
MDNKSVSNDMRRATGFYHPDSPPPNETQVKAQFKNRNIWKRISSSIKRWFVPSSRKKYELAIPLLERTSHPSAEGVSIQHLAQKESIPTDKVCIGDDHWKQMHYETNLEGMLFDLKKSDDSVSYRSSRSNDSKFNSGFHSNQASVDPDDIRVRSLSSSSTDSMPDAFSIESDSVFVSEEPVWDQLITAIPEGEPTNSHEQQLQARSLSVLSNLSNETVGGVKPEASPRKRYKQMLSKLRKIHASLQKVTQPPSEVCQASSALVREVSRVLFMAPRNNGFYTKLVQTTKEASGFKFPEIRGCLGKQLAQRLKVTQKSIHSQQRVLEDPSGVPHHLINMGARVITSEMGINYDPYLQGNQPYPLFDFYAGERKITCIRMGTPTTQSLLGREKVTPEFKAFLSGLPDGAQHFYINRQKRSGVEGGRSRVLEKFQHSPESSGKLTVVTFPADGVLYQQKGPYSQESDFSQMSDQLINAMMNNSNGFYFPETFKQSMGGKESFNNFLNNAMKEMAIELEIKQGVPMDKSLRRASIFHLLNKTLPELIRDKLGADTYNNTCKDDIDRGGMANAYMYLCKKAPISEQNPEQLEAWMQDVEGVVFAPAITVKKREVIQHRFDDLTNVLERLPFWNKNEVHP